MTGPGSAGETPTLSLDERLVLGHVAVLVVFLGWAYGGQIGWAREIATLWSLAGGGALAWRLLWRRGATRGEAAREHLRRLWPLLGLALLSATAAAFPAFRAGQTEAGAVFIEQPLSRWWPVAARPEFAVREQALAIGLILSAFNLALGVHHRRGLRGLVIFLAANTVLLAVAGTLQKLLGLSLYFGAATSPNPSFFGTFVYHNHWAAFALLGVGASAALLFQRRSPDEATGVRRSPAALSAAGIIAVLATLPLSTSRSGTILGAVAGSALLVFGAVRAARRSRRTRQRWLAVAILAAVFACVATVSLARPFFGRRLVQTAQQLDQLRAGEFAAVDDRPAVYRATGAMIAARPLFGWGPGGYGAVYPLYRRPETAGLHFEHAHSDWLETLAERGLAGTALLLALVVALLRPLVWRELPAFSGWLLGGCGLIALYAAVEFPFANPAVFATWWVFAVAAVRYQHLSPRFAP